MPNVNIKNIIGITTRSSTISVNAGVPSIGEVHRKQCYSLYQPMKTVDNHSLNEYADYAIYDSICINW